MAASVHEILALLDPHWDRVVRRPLSEAEVDDLARQVGLPVPAPLSDYLRKVGLFQDLTFGVSTIQVYGTLSEFFSAREFLSSLLPPKYDDLFPFGGDGAGNEYCLRTSDEAACCIYLVDHDSGKVARRKEFAEWLESVVTKVMKGIRKRLPNDQKVWSVQFSLPNMSFAQLMDLLSSVTTVNSLDSDWMKRKTSRDKVTSSERRFEIDGLRLRATQLEYGGWDGPVLSFDMREPCHDGVNSSKIRTLNALFRINWPSYKLVDYGPLALKQLE